MAETIVLVDDQKLVREGLKILLANPGLEVVEKRATVGWLWHSSRNSDPIS